MKRLVVIMLGLVCLACAGVGALESGAAFTYGSVSTVTASAAGADSWLHLYSSVTDPDFDTGYAARAGYTPTTPAASGQDETLAVHLGAFPNKNQNYDTNRVLKLKTPATFPGGVVTSVKATCTLVADVSGRQPITSMGVRPWGTTGFTGTTVTVSNWAANTKYQLNLRVHFGNWTQQQYIPKVRVVVTYTGFTTTYYQYDIPIKVNYGPSPGPN